MKLLLMGLGAVMRSEGDGGGGSAAAQELGLAQTSVIISSAKFDSEEAASGWAQTLSEEGRSDRFRPAKWGKAALDLLDEADRPTEGFSHFDEKTDRAGEVEITGYNALYGVVADGEGFVAVVNVDINSASSASAETATEEPAGETEETAPTQEPAEGAGNGGSGETTADSEPEEKREE